MSTKVSLYFFEMGDVVRENIEELNPEFLAAIGEDYIMRHEAVFENVLARFGLYDSTCVKDEATPAQISAGESAEVKLANMGGLKITEGLIQEVMLLYETITVPLRPESVNRMSDEVEKLFRSNMSLTFYISID